ncbi:hypothetical protein FRC03_006099 [Tulasnella sp. 419]|nr:hypothetical protein FRC02_008433 [Tulasnella sp. 418]KAG8960820.1 hypothetical protein FRC03_006099 [Tulasnella sp. 419]
MSTGSVAHKSELSLSSLSIASSNHSEDMDWDRSLTDIDVTPSTPTHTEVGKAYLNQPQVQLTPSGKSGKSLAEILQQHADRSTARDDTQSVVSLSADEERVLEEELGRWIHSDLSPYEPEVHHARSASLDGLKLIKPSALSIPRQRSNSVTPADSPNVRSKALAS